MCKGSYLLDKITGAGLVHAHLSCFSKRVPMLTVDRAALLRLNSLLNAIPLAIHSVHS